MTVFAPRAAAGTEPTGAPPVPPHVANGNGATRALLPIENKRNFLGVSADIVEHVAPFFFGNPKTATMKVLEGR